MTGPVEELSLSIESAPPDRLNQLVAEASLLREAGRAADALSLLMFAVEAEPDCAEYIYQLGRAHFDLDHLDDAALSFARAADLYPDHWPARYWLGVTYVRLQEWEEAEEILCEVTRHETAFPGGHFYLGVVQEELGKLDAAEASYEHVLTLDPTDARTHFFLGCLAAGRAHMIKARAELEILQTLDADLAAELEECLAFCDALDTLGPSATIAFVEKVQQDGITYEILEARNAATARAFLMARPLKRPGYVVRVITPQEGIWSLDLCGLHLDKILPFQIHLRAAKVVGKIVGTPHPESLAAAASGQSDNYVVEVQCAHCHHTWPDALRYQKPTLVKCPECGTLNKLDP